MNERDWLAERFEQHRPELRRVAYRMLGSLDETDDAIQEAWLRLSRSDDAAINNLGAWLTTVVGRVCLDMLRRRRARREDGYGSWLPEPVVVLDEGVDPAAEALVADSVGLALLVVLETLSPPERVAFVLHDMFALPFEEIGEILERSPAAARQLASRARRRVRSAEAQPDIDVREQRTVADAFLAAARDGDFEALVNVLHPDVVFRVDTGHTRREPRPPIHGAEAVASEVLGYARLAAHARPALVNGTAGFVVGVPERPFAVVGFNVSDGRITAIDLILDPEKLPRESAAIDG